MPLIHIEDYFAPLGLHTGLIIIGLIFAFKALGFTFRKYVLQSIANGLAAIDWIIGLGLFLSFWFFAGLFFAPTQANILTSLIIVSAVPVYYFLHTTKIADFKNAIRESWIPVLLLAPFLPAIFVKASLPPYYSDEMAYHFVSPSALKSLTTWKFDSGVFSMIPRMMDMFYLLGFSLSKTHTIGRSIHFLILATSLIFTFKFLKVRQNIFAAIIFVFAFLSIPQEIAFTSTLGFVDVANYSLILVASVLGLAFITTPDQSLLILSFAFWGMALGTKYTGLTFFAPFLMIMVGWLVFKWRSFRDILTPRLISLSLVTFFIFGGYWYVKNLLVTGNPIYPFLFPCYRWAEKCAESGGFFGSWTLPVTFQNLPIIVEQLFVQPEAYLTVFIIGMVGLLKARPRKDSLIVSVGLMAIILELAILSHFSGFLIRYQQHEQLILLYCTAVAVGALIQLFKSRILKWALTATLIGILFTNYKQHITQTYTPGRIMTEVEINYALGRADIYDFIKWRMPNALPFIKWCNNPPDGKTVEFVRFDPDLIWWDDAAAMHQYFTNCQFGSQVLPIIDNIESLKKIAIEKKLVFNVLTINPCMAANEVKKKVKNEDDPSLVMRRVNNFVVCNSEALYPGYVYRFDYHKLLSKAE
jgi:hypothetical protein